MPDSTISLTHILKTHYFVRSCFSLYTNTTTLGLDHGVHPWKEAGETRGSLGMKGLRENGPLHAWEGKTGLQRRHSDTGRINLQAHRRSDPQSTVHRKMIRLTINILHACFWKFHNVLKYKETPQTQILICNNVITCVFQANCMNTSKTQDSSTRLPLNLNDKF